MTKLAGIEGTGIIAYEKEDVLQAILSKEELQEAKDLLNYISVVPEGIVAGKIGVTSMHDVTEGGLLGAVWEICSGVNLGAYVYDDKITLHPVTEKICNHFEINPLRLISSGTMVMTVKQEKVNELMTAFEEKNIMASVIGEITPKDVYLEKHGRMQYVTPPDSDELYKVVF
jgi:hydrogenase expression/formation protein HypE